MPFSIAYDKPDDANRYDGARTLPEETMTLWLDALAKHVNYDGINRVVDMGCGTGRFTLPLATAIGCAVVGVDPSQAMLDVAARQSAANVEWMQGDAENIPLPNQSVNLVFMSQVFHHIADPEKALREFDRVLTSGGQLAIRNATKENVEATPWLHCFPDALDIELGRQLSQQSMIDLVCEHGFELASWETVHQRFASSYDEYFDKISRRGLSALISISDASFSDGVRRLRAWTDKQPKGVAVFEPIDLFVFRKK